MLLLDTCALIFDALAPEEFSKRARTAIERASLEGGIAVCDITLWEIAMLVQKARLDPGTDAGEFLRLALSARAVSVLPINEEIAVCSVGLDLHGDPADRLITATAIVHNARLVTCDKAIRRCREVKTVW